MKTIAMLLALMISSPWLVGPVGEAPARNGWSQWRGPERSGHYRGPAWPERLSPDNLRLLWRVPLAPSYSGAIVDAERVYSTETNDRGEEVVRAFDRRTGEEVWSHRWPGSIQVPFFAARNGSWIRSTPTHDGRSLYVAGMEDVLICLDAETGEEQWRVDFAERFAAPRPEFGFVCSPLVRGEFVYVQAGASFVKLHKRDGSTVWRTLEDTGGMYGGAFSSPVFASLHGRQQIVVQSRTALNGVCDETGEVLWSVPVRSFRGMNILTPVPYGDGVFTSAYGGRAQFVSVDQRDGDFAAESAWSNRAQGYMTSPVVIGSHAYLYLRSKRFACVDLESGAVRWISGPIGDEYQSLIAQGDRILALSDAGQLRLLKADPEEFEVIDSMAVSTSETWAHLAMDGEQVFVRELDGLAVYSWR